MFYFNFDKYEFWKIYDSIKHFYPIGIRKDETKFFYSYPGVKELEKIIVDNINNEKHYEQRWLSFTNDLHQATGIQIIGTTFGQAPSFSAYALLGSTTTNGLTRIKELHFFVSSIGPYYTVVGEDANVVKINNRQYRSTNYLAVSPTKEFDDLFQLTCNKIENTFQAFRFVPFDICRQTIEGLDVYYSGEGLKAVFHAIFNDHIDLETRNLIGDTYYKSEDWIREDHKD